MRNPGFDKPLYILPFDHRGSFQKKMFGWDGALTAGQTAEIAAAKRVIYDGFLAAVEAGVCKDKAGILVDEQFGAARTNSTSSMANDSRSTSRPSIPRFARCWSVTTRRATRC